MCGIAGINRKDKNMIKDMVKMLYHRGPDMEGVYIDENVSLGHTRLSILDLSENGKQPMRNEDGSLYVVFNGEIFNYHQLKDELVSKGHTFTSNTDTEVLIHGYEEYGKDLPVKLNGQFAFCLYDKKQNLFFLARDRMGILPLFYYISDDFFVFASELKGIFSASIPKQINKTAFMNYFRFRAISAPASIIENVFKLEPAHCMVYDLTLKKILEKKRYWSFPQQQEKQNIRSLINDIRDMIRRSVEQRIAADVPVGAFLSGGVDSSIVVSVFSQLRKGLKTFSVRFEDQDFDEGKFAEQIARKMGTEHHEVFLKDEDVPGIIPVLVESYDEPMADPSCLPTYFLSRFAREHVTVCISGDGGDELLGGYNRYQYFSIAKKLNAMPNALKWACKKVFCFLGLFLKKFEIERIIEILSVEKMEDLKLYERLVEKIDRKDLSAILKEKVFFNDTTENFVKRKGLISLQHYDILHYLEGDILVKVDRAAMAVNLETRPPLLDHNFVQMCLSIQDNLKIKGNCGKWILKKAFEHILPKEIIRRRKKGFGIPIQKYLDQPLKPFVDKYVLNYEGHDLFDNSYIRKMQNDNSKDTARLFWTIMMFNMWYDRWMLDKKIDVKI
ncbi:MAG: asparagine synthase (glutamine-hydrolyzing) [Candidatus Omnitrophica bacterium]|nr:asparagine synthase (glutamine-hydrolyzing) [Candidatus Omnitrophota bacterium]